MVAASHHEEPMRMTEIEYFEFEEKSETRHEFVNGKVYAMTGASRKHTVICMNLGTTLNNQLASKDCTPVANELRLKVAAKVSYRYPDVMVICGEPSFVNKRVDTIDNPTVIIEVLSSSTALIDYNEKLREYRQLETVQEYLLVSQNEARIEKYARYDADKWLYSETIGLENRIELPSIECVLALSDIYNKITFDSDSDEIV